MSSCSAFLCYITCATLQSHQNVWQGFFFPHSVDNTDLMDHKSPIPDHTNHLFAFVISLKSCGNYTDCLHGKVILGKASNVFVAVL